MKKWRRKVPASSSISMGNPFAAAQKFIPKKLNRKPSKYPFSVAKPAFWFHDKLSPSS
jgi:hypothetical protein